MSRIDNLGLGAAAAFGEIAGAGEIGNSIYMNIPIQGSASGGTYDVYLVTSQDGVNWTDGIDPTDSTGDVAASVSDAIYLKSTAAEAGRTTAKLSFSVGMLNNAEYIGFVLVNSSGQTVPAGASGTSQAQKVSA